MPGPEDSLDQTQDIAPERLREMARTSLLDLERGAPEVPPDIRDTDWDAEPTKVAPSPFGDDEQPRQGDASASEALLLAEPPRAPSTSPPEPPAAAGASPASGAPLPPPRARSKTLVGFAAAPALRPVGARGPVGPAQVVTGLPAVDALPERPRAPDPPDPASPTLRDAPLAEPPRRVLPPLATSPVRPDPASLEGTLRPAESAGSLPAPIPFPVEPSRSPSPDPELPTAPRQPRVTSLKPAMAPRVQVPPPSGEDTGPSGRSPSSRPPPARAGGVVHSKLALVLAVTVPLVAGVTAGLLFFRPATESPKASATVPPDVAPPVAAPRAKSSAVAAMTTASPSEAVPTAEPVAAEPVAAEPVAAEPPAPLVERARRGEEAAMTELADKPAIERNVEESLALAEGKVMTKRRIFEAFAQSLRDKPESLADEHSLTTLREFIDDRDTAIASLRMLAELPGELSADVLYDVWVGTRGRNDTTWLAEQLCHTEAVRQKASRALQVALALRSTEECEPIRDTLSQIAEHGDQRSTRLVKRLLSPRGCGPSGRDDCFACLRPLDRDKKAIGARTALSMVRGRRAPKVR